MALLQKGYLGATPLFRQKDWFEDRANTLVSSDTALVTGAATIHTKGSYSEIIASTPANADVLAIAVEGLSVNNSNSAAIIDIAFGAAGSESVKLADIAVGGARASGGVAELGSLQFVVPFQVPSGTRIAARLQGVNASEVARIFVQVLSMGSYATAPTSVDTIGGDTSTSTGLAMSGSSGTWVEASASTSQAYRGVIVVPSLNATTAINTTQNVFEIGTGASGSEASFGFFNARYSSDESIINGRQVATNILGNAIPAGSRLAVKHDIASNPSLYQVTLICIP